MKKSFEQRFWEKVAVAGPDDCWEWQAGINNQTGYGHLNLHDGTTKQGYAHRVAYTLTNGPIPDGLWILHSCDNRRCVNPAHLRAGTPKENVADMMSRGRQRRGRCKTPVQINLDRGTWKPNADGRKAPRRDTPVHIPFMKVMMFVHDKSVSRIAAETNLDIKIVRRFRRGDFFQPDVAEKIAICLRTDVDKLLSPGDVVFGGVRVVKRQTPGYCTYHGADELLIRNGHVEPAMEPA